MMRFDFAGGGEGFEETCRAVGQFFARAREDLEMTPEEVARIARVSQATVRRIESGELGPFSIGTLERIAATLGIVLDMDVAPRDEELVVLAATTAKPIRVFGREPGRRRGNDAAPHPGRTDSV